MGSPGFSGLLTFSLPQAKRSPEVPPTQSISYRPKEGVLLKRNRLRKWTNSKKISLQEIGYPRWG